MFTEKFKLTTSRVQTQSTDIVLQYPTEFADLTQNHQKIIGTPNQSIRMKIFPNKACSVP
jgi:hypothetical protein